MNVCPELHELLVVKDRPAGDAGREHLESCPRCRNRMAQYAEFQTPASLPLEADLADAERRLAASLTTLRGRAPESVPSRATPRPIPRERSGLLSAFVDWLAGPRLWRLAVGGVAIAAVAVVVVRPWGTAPPPVSTLRAGGEKRAIQLGAPSVLPDGRVRLEWSADAEAEAYRVRILGPDLTEVLSRDVAEETSLVVDRSMLAARLEPGTVLGWNVGVIRGGGELRRSATGTLRAP